MPRGVKSKPAMPVDPAPVGFQVPNRFIATDAPEPPEPLTTVRLAWDPDHAKDVASTLELITRVCQSDMTHYERMLKIHSDHGQLAGHATSVESEIRFSQSKWVTGNTFEKLLFDHRYCTPSDMHNQSSLYLSLAYWSDPTERPPKNKYHPHVSCSLERATEVFREVKRLTADPGFPMVEHWLGHFALLEDEGIGKGEYHVVPESGACNNRTEAYFEMDLGPHYHLYCELGIALHRQHLGLDFLKL